MSRAPPSEEEAQETPASYRPGLGGERSGHFSVETGRYLPFFEHN